MLFKRIREEVLQEAERGSFRSGSHDAAKKRPSQARLNTSKDVSEDKTHTPI
ncbi:hypothetical protein W02_27520 [Nitrospira sp. KM1]|nr:hypothetical protein W02_27520 [Nitrospira sp. KM1]